MIKITKNLLKNLSDEVLATDVKIENNSLKKRTVRKLGQLGLSLFSVVFLASSAGAVDAADVGKNVVGAQGGKEVLIQALKLARSKPAMSIATAVVGIACVPAAGATASASMCVACGILIAKILK